MKVIHPERFARALTRRGVLAFDYRGFGVSEGERGRLVPQEWVEDIRAAVDRVTGHPDLDPNRIALLGWGLGGGAVITEAADDPRVRAVVACNAIADGYRSTRNMHTEESWESLLNRIVADRTRRSELGRSESTSPWDIVRLDLDSGTDGYVQKQLYQAPTYGSAVTLESADFLLRFRPQDLVHRIAPRPILVIHGAANRLHLPAEATALVEAAREPKRLELLEGHGHTEWMFDDHPTFVRVIELVAAFVAEAFGSRTDNQK